MYESWFKNGKPHERGNYKDGIIDGMYESWFNHPVGQRSERYSVKDGEIDGMYESWCENGQYYKSKATLNLVLKLDMED